MQTERKETDAKHYPLGEGAVVAAYFAHVHQIYTYLRDNGVDDERALEMISIVYGRHPRVIKGIIDDMNTCRAYGNPA